jgi:hypothetical protein
MFTGRSRAPTAIRAHRVIAGFILSRFQGSDRMSTETDIAMTKAVTVVMLVLVCIAGICVAYYFVRFLPGVRDAERVEQRRKTDLERAQRCNTDAKRFYADFRKRISSESPESSSSWHDPEMHFNRKLNTCLVEIGWDDIRGDGLYRTEFLLDVYSNGDIISTFYTFERGEPKPVPFAGGMDPKQYLAEKNRLFGE